MKKTTTTVIPAVSADTVSADWPSATCGRNTVHGSASQRAAASAGKQDASVSADTATSTGKSVSADCPSAAYGSARPAATGKQSASPAPVAPEPSQVQGFEIKPYLKRELAQLYFPDMSPEYALKKLRSWINVDADLKRRLYDGPEGRNDQCFSRRQVRLLIHHLDPP